ncbi:MAG TPA: histidine phosphatase family protein [Candidatus Limnocylindrales bacterium]|nr:histidine phosphatase family protein [Candidatus Limnocylindrales bacterium]
MGSIFLVRHATTAASASGANLGQASDPTLTADGQQLAARLGRAIALEHAALPHDELRLISSPARRCLATAAAIQSMLGNEAAALTTSVEDGLRELDYGAWEGLTPEECRRRDPALRAAWEADPYATRSPGGESGQDVAARSFPVLEVVEAWLALAPSRAAVVVSHNHVVRLRLASRLGIPLPDYRRRLRIEPGSYSVLTFGAGMDGPSVRRIAAMPPDRPI